MKKTILWDTLIALVLPIAVGVFIVTAQILNPNFAWNPFRPAAIVQAANLPAQAADIENEAPSWNSAPSKMINVSYQEPEVKRRKWPRRPTKTPQPTPTVAELFIPTSTPNQPPAAPEPAGIVWEANHEDGTISAWQAHGDFLRQGKTGAYFMENGLAHSGNYSVGLSIDTDGKSSSGDHAAYLFYWDQLPGDAYYYSAWYYIPGGTHPQDWWNIWQWKSTYNGNTDSSVPMYILDMTENNAGQLALRLIYRPDIKDKVLYRQDNMTVPTDQWVQIEAYYKKGTSNNGQVIVWQDGVEIFNLSGVQTTEKDNTVYWSLNNYTDRIEPHNTTIYVDDAAISTERLGPNSSLP